MSENIQINGLKLSGPMTAVRVSGRHEGPQGSSALCRILAANQINIAYLAAASRDEAETALLCVDERDRSASEHHMSRRADLQATVNISKEAVGLISLYPHKAGLAVLGVALQALTAHGITVHGLSSSIAAFTFVVDYETVSGAANCLAEALSLSVDQITTSNQTNIRRCSLASDGRTVTQFIHAGNGSSAGALETAAVYWEPKVRTYGFNLKENLMLVRVKLPIDRLPAWNRTMAEGQGRAVQFQLVWAQGHPCPTHVRFFLLCEDDHWRKLAGFWDGFVEKNDDSKTGPGRLVDGISFQGPHFGDRYGIMDFTYDALSNAQIPVLGVSCSTASIYLVLPPGYGRRTKRALTEAFEIPMGKRRD